VSEIFDWAKTVRWQPEPITLAIWQELPEEFCRQVELVDGQAVRCASPTRTHQRIARALTNQLEVAARRHRRETDECFDADGDFDVVLWELPHLQIRRPDAALYRCVPDDGKPLPANLVQIVVEVISGAGRAEAVDKRAEYAAAGIPWYWLVRLADGAVSSIEVLALDHGARGYRTVAVAEPGDTRVDGPIRVELDWSQLRFG
jgi:Uma2 family endonuclease